MFELILLPLLAVVGLSFVFDAWSPLGNNGENNGGNSTKPESEGDVFGPGNDVTLGTSGDDLIFTLKGNDFATGGAGDDRIYLGDGFDRTADGEFQNLETFDTARFEGNDLIRGGAKADFVYDSMGQNSLFGDTGADRVFGVDDASDFGTPDQLFGGHGDDIIRGDDGDVMSGGTGKDSFEISHRATAAAVNVTDFEAGETIKILDSNNNPIAANRIGVASANGGLDTNVSVDGKVVATLTGVGTAPAGLIANVVG